MHLGSWSLSKCTEGYSSGEGMTVKGSHYRAVVPSTLQEWCNNPFPVMFWGRDTYTSDKPPDHLWACLFYSYLLITLAVNHFGCPERAKLGHCTSTLQRILNPSLSPNTICYSASHFRPQNQTPSRSALETLQKKAWLVWDSVGSFLFPRFIPPVHSFYILFYMQIYLYLIALQFFLSLV